MSFGVAKYLESVDRSVSSLETDGKPSRAVTLSRSYETSAEDLWDALTNPERLPRWFLPVEGELRQGGRYQLHGNAWAEADIANGTEQAQARDAAERTVAFFSARALGRTQKEYRYE